MNIMKDLPIKGVDTFFLDGAYLVEDPIESITYMQYAGRMIEQEKLFHLMRLRFETSTKLRLHETEGPFAFCYWTRLHPEQVLAAIEEIDHPVKDNSLIVKMEQIMDGSAAGMRMFRLSVKRWYAKQYFYDAGGIDALDPDVTFEQILRGLADGEDFYDMIGVADSAIREAVFKRLKQLLGCEYEDVYHLWLAN